MTTLANSQYTHGAALPVYTHSVTFSHEIPGGPKEEESCWNLSISYGLELPGPGHSAQCLGSQAVLKDICYLAFLFLIFLIFNLLIQFP